MLITWDKQPSLQVMSPELFDDCILIKAPTSAIVAEQLLSTAPCTDVRELELLLIGTVVQVCRHYSKLM